MKEKLESGEALILEGKWQSAENHFEIMNSKFPDHPDILNNLGIVKEAGGRLPEAETCFRKAVQCNPQHSNALMNLAQLFSKTARWRLASKCMEKLVAAGDATPEVYNQMAVYYLNIGNTKNAEQALSASLALDPAQPVVEKTLQQVRDALPTTNQLEDTINYRVAFSEINITPPVSENEPVLLQGMAGAPREAVSVDQPLMMQILLLEDKHQTRLLFVTADLFGFDERMVADIQQAAEPWGIAPEGIILNASHTHYAPGTVSGLLPVMGHYYADFADQIKRLIINNISFLYQKLEPCQIYRSATDAQIGINRRLNKDGKITFGPNPDGPYDRHTPFAIVDLCESDHTILLINHGCHPTGMGDVTQIASDYPGYLRDALVSGGFANGVMFFQGAAGDIKEAAWNQNTPAFCESGQDAQQNGHRLASELVSALQYPVEPVTGPFFCTKEALCAALKPPMSTIQMQGLVGEENPNLLIRQWADRFLPSVRKGTVDTGISIEIQWVSLGERIQFITFQGEPVTQLAQSIRSLVKNPEGTFLLGYTNGLKSYIPTDKMIGEGGYEVEFSHCVYPRPSGLDSGIEGKIKNVISHFNNAVRQIGKPNGYGRYHLTPNPKKAFFVMSAGRCGTMTMAHILNTAENARVWHHPQPDPIRESLLAYWGQIDKKAAFWKARHSLINETWAKGKIHGETDLLMTPFCDMLAEEIEGAKFLILTRHPADFVRSGMKRNYYGGHPWDFGRLRPHEGSDGFETWNAQDQFHKTCWLWRETYLKILKIRKAVGHGKVMVVRFEDLIGNLSEIEKIFEFLNLRQFKVDRILPIFDQKLNVQKTGYFPKYNQWPQELKKKLWDTCGDVASNFGYQSHHCKKVSDKTAAQVPALIKASGKRIVFISGMHRSGTSFLSRALNLCGLNLPNPDSIGNQSNEKGRWENRELSLAGRKLFGTEDRWYDPVVIHDTEEVLAEMRTMLAKYHSLFDLWGWKDPRTLITFEHWKRVMPVGTQFDIVVSIRNPYEVAESLNKRNKIPLTQGMRLWERYNNHVLKFIQKGYPVHLFNFNATDKRKELDRICAKLDLTMNKLVWDKWFDQRLVHHGGHQVPCSPIYQRLMAMWHAQVGSEDKDDNIVVNDIKPPLPLAILMVNGRHNYKDNLWLEKAIDNIIKYTSVYRDFRIFLWNHDHKNKAVLKYLAHVSPYVETLDETSFDVRSFQSPKYDFSENNILNYHGFHVHRTPLQILYNYAIENYAVETVFTMDTDSWPVRANWDLYLVGALDLGAKLTGVWRDEMASAIKPFVHASGLGIKAETIAKIGLRFDSKPDGPHEDTLSHFTRVIQQRYGKDAIHPLKRSNRKQYHPVYGGLYGDLIYHHHQGTIYRDGKQNELLFKGSSDRGESAESNKLICDALTEMLFSNHDEYINELMYGDAYDQLKIVYYLFKNRSSSRDRIQHMLQLAKMDIENQPLRSFFILNLVCRYYAFDPSMLTMMAKVCSTLDLHTESQQYEALAACH